MKKMLCFFVCLLFAIPIYAADLEIGFDYYVTPNPHFNTHEDGLGGHARVRGQLINELYWYAELGHITDVQYVSGTDNLGEIRAYTGLLGVIFAPKTDIALKPYIFAGVGAGWWDFKESPFLQEEGIKIETDVSFVSKVGGGIIWNISEQWSIEVESGWFQARVPVQCTDDGVDCALPDDDPTGVEFIPVSVKGRYKF